MQEDSKMWYWLAATLDEIDYGVLLVFDGGRLGHANHAARGALDGEHPLQINDGELRARRTRDAQPLRDAIEAAARRGLRQMLCLGTGEQEVSVAVVPLPGAQGVLPPAALLLVGKRKVCGELAVQGFARTHGLTPAETAVLAHLCQGIQVKEIAARQAVAVSTIRTQIGAIRLKTGAATIGALLQQLAVLPPMVTALRAQGGVL